MYRLLIKRVQKKQQTVKDESKALRGLQERPEQFLQEIDSMVRRFQKIAGKPVQGLTEEQRDEYWGFVRTARQMQKMHQSEDC